jgi:FkbM family methyltransferase
MLIAYSLNPRKIHVIEADPGNFQAIKTNCIKNYLDDKVELLHTCVSDKTGDIIEFGWTDENRPDTSTKTMNSPGGVKVMTTDILEYLKSKDLANTSIIKIDIEGAERLCHKGLDYISKFPGISVLLSMHPAFWPDKAAAAKLLMPEFRKFDVFTEQEQPLPLEKLNDMLLDESSCDWVGKTGVNFTMILKTKG